MRKTMILHRNRRTVNNNNTHIYFFSRSSAGQVSLMAYLPDYNLGCPDKSIAACDHKLILT